MVKHRCSLQLVFFTLCILFLATTVVVGLLGQEGSEVDVTWDFNEPDRITEWDNGANEQRQISNVNVHSGELAFTIQGYNPSLEAPSMMLAVTQDTFCIIRARYNGAATQGQLLLRSGSAPSPPDQLTYSRSYWQQRQNMTANTITPQTSGLIAVPGSTSIPNDVSNVVDQNDYTYFEAARSTLVIIELDLGSHRKITQLHLRSIGGEDSARKCILQESSTSGRGPYRTILTFIADDSTENQLFQYFEGNARHFQLIVVDNYGGEHVSIREVSLSGYDERVVAVPFDIQNDGLYQVLYIPIHTYLSGMLTRMRLELLFTKSRTEYNTNNGAVPVFRETMALDYVTIARRPFIYRVTGCSDKYYDNGNYMNPQYNVSESTVSINGDLVITSVSKLAMDLMYAKTYDCPLEGGTTITVVGINFGKVPIVTVDGVGCLVLTNVVSEDNGRERTITFALPRGTNGDKTVRVSNGVHPKMFHEHHALAYRVAPSVPSRPTMTNIAACKVDLIWTPPGDDFNKMTVTGYVVAYFSPQFPSRKANFTVGNITTTSVRELTSGVEYVFMIAAVAEGRENANLATDLYGRRDLTANAVVGAFSTMSNVTATMISDFSFKFFNSNETLNSSSASGDASVGPTGIYDGEGNFGLTIVGDANLQNCNVSSTCCDGYNATIGLASCGDYRSVCAVLASRMLPYDLVENDVSRRGTQTALVNVTDVHNYSLLCVLPNIRFHSDFKENFKRCCSIP
jgi:hypothetical protein